MSKEEALEELLRYCSEEEVELLEEYDIFVDGEIDADALAENGELLLGEMRKYEDLREDVEKLPKDARRAFLSLIVSDRCADFVMSVVEEGE